jgi:hypothetical protein
LDCRGYGRRELTAFLFHFFEKPAGALPFVKKRRNYSLSVTRKDKTPTEHPRGHPKTTTKFRNEHLDRTSTTQITLLGRPS